MAENFDAKAHAHILDRRVIDFQNYKDKDTRDALQNEVIDINRQTAGTRDGAAAVWKHSVLKGKVDSETSRTETYLEMTPLKQLVVKPVVNEVVSNQEMMKIAIAHSKEKKERESKEKAAAPLPTEQPSSPPPEIPELWKMIKKDVQQAREAAPAITVKGVTEGLNDFSQTMKSLADTLESFNRAMGN